MNIQDKVAVITGGASGLGLATAKALKEKGAKLMLLDLNEDNAKAAVAELGENADYCITNVIEEDNVKAAMDKTVEKFGAIHILINCAGIQYISKIENFPTNEWRKVIDINLTSSFITSKNIIPVMKKNNSGRIINISSVHGLVASENKSAYVASKHGLIGLTKAIALELSKTKITCNAISPGWVLTPLVEKQIKKLASKNKTSIEIEKKNLLFEKHPNQKFVSGKEIASLVNFLISKDAQNITGSSYSIDGGWVSV